MNKLRDWWCRKFHHLGRPFRGYFPCISCSRQVPIHPDIIGGKRMLLPAQQEMTALGEQLKARLEFDEWLKRNPR